MPYHEKRGEILSYFPKILDPDGKFTHTEGYQYIFDLKTGYLSYSEEKRESRRIHAVLFENNIPLKYEGLSLIHI